MKKAGIGPVLTLLASVFSAQAAGGALPDDEVVQPGGWRDVARPLVSSLKNLASEFSRSVLEEARQARLKAEAQALLFASAQRPIAAVLDMNHRTGDAQSFLNNPYLAAGWKAQGKKAVFLELPESMQPIFDRFYKGETRKGDFRKEIAVAGINRWLRSPLRERVVSNFVEGVALLKAAGIGVYGVNSHLDLSDKEEKALAMLSDFVRREVPGDQVQNILDKGFPGGKVEFDRALNQIDIKNYLRNKNVAAKIKHHLRKGDDAVIVYGGWHFRGQLSLDGMLGKKNVVTIALFPSSKDYIGKSFGKDSPHYVFIHRNGEFFLDSGGQMAGLPQFHPPDTHQPENPAMVALVSALRAPAPKY